MRKRDREFQIIDNVLVEDFAAEGKSIARVDEMVVFIDNAVPGDIIKLKIKNKKKNFAEGIATEFNKYSSSRIEPFCSHFGTCGGCKWQNLDYEKQLDYKQKQVVDSIQRIGKISDFEINNIISSPKIQYYRNKLEFTFSNRRWLFSGEDIINPKDNNGLGFHIPRMYDRILDISKCYLQNELSNEIRNSIKEFANDNDYSFYDARKQNGLLRNLIIRTSTSDEIMVLINFKNYDEKKIHALMDFIKNKFPSITSLLYSVNPQVSDSLYNYNDIITYHGKEFIYESLGSLKFKIGPKSFFQTNTIQAEKMYEYIKLHIDGFYNSTIYDLYTGTGTIANYIAEKCSLVVGIDYVNEAIEDAKENSVINNISNTEFISGDMKDVFNDELVDKYGFPEIVITDPPRAGMHTNVINTLIKSKANKIIYVSCNPATQARDLDLLRNNYKLISIQPFDMFPHTHHVENIAILEKLT